MDANAIVTLITTVGFPIVMCGAMGWFVKDQTDKNRLDMSEERASHQEETAHMIEAINNNTLAIQKLTDYIERK